MGELSPLRFLKVLVLGGSSVARGFGTHQLDSGLYRGMNRGAMPSSLQSFGLNRKAPCGFGADFYLHLPMAGLSPAQEPMPTTEVAPLPGGILPVAEDSQGLEMPAAPTSRFPTLIQLVGVGRYRIPEAFFAKPEGFVGAWTPPRRLEGGRHWPTSVTGGTCLYNGNNRVLHGFGQESAGWSWSDLGWVRGGLLANQPLTARQDTASVPIAMMSSKEPVWSQAAADDMAGIMAVEEESPTAAAATPAPLLPAGSPIQGPLAGGPAFASGLEALHEGTKQAQKSGGGEAGALNPSARSFSEGSASARDSSSPSARGRKHRRRDPSIDKRSRRQSGRTAATKQGKRGKKRRTRSDSTSSTRRYRPGRGGALPQVQLSGGDFTGWLIDLVEKYGGGLKVTDGIHLRQLVGQAFESLAVAHKKIRDLQGEIFEKAVLHEKEVKNLTAALQDLTKMVNGATSARADILTHVKSLIRLAEGMPSQDIVQKTLARTAPAKIPTTPASQEPVPGIAGQAAPSSKAAGGAPMAGTGQGAGAATAPALPSTSSFGPGDTGEMVLTGRPFNVFGPAQKDSVQNHLGKAKSSAVCGVGRFDWRQKVLTSSVDFSGPIEAFLKENQLYPWQEAYPLSVFYTQAEEFAFLQAPPRMVVNILRVLRAKEIPNLKGCVPASIVLAKLQEARPSDYNGVQIYNLLAAGVDEEGIPKDLHYGFVGFGQGEERHVLFLIREGASLGRIASGSSGRAANKSHGGQNWSGNKESSWWAGSAAAGAAATGVWEGQGNI